MPMYFRRIVVPIVTMLPIGLPIVGCGPQVSVPTQRFEAHDGHVTPLASVFQPVRLFDKAGRSTKILAQRGAGPWRSPRGDVVYFVRYIIAERQKRDDQTLPTVTGTLYRADASGNNQVRVQLPRPVLPCELEVSPSGRFLAITYVPLRGNPSEHRSDLGELLLMPRHLAVYNTESGSWLPISYGWPGGHEFAWSPIRDQLLFVCPADRSAINAVGELLAQRSARARNARQGTVEADAGTLRESAATADSNSSEYPTSPVGFGRELLDFGDFFSMDLLTKAPRSTIVGFWSLDAENPVAKLRLHRPHYAGLEWMPDGRHVLLFSIDGQPAPVRAHSPGGVFPRFVCHGWDTQSGLLTRIPVPRSDAFAALPSLRDGARLLWLCGNREHDLILTDAEGSDAKAIARGVMTDFRPHWVTPHVLHFIRQCQAEPHGNEPAPVLSTLVVFDTRTMRAVKRELGTTVAP